MQCRYEDIGYWGIPGIQSLFTHIILQSKTSAVQNVSYHFHAITTCIVGIYMLCMLSAYRFDSFFSQHQIIANKNIS